jgi:GNAT superfamily N-acetyltransferase
MVPRLAEEYNLQLDVEVWVEEAMTEVLSQPGSHLLLAYEGPETAGMGCLRKIGDEMGEIIRLYVRPAYRRKGIGREILECLLQEARAMGYTKIRLGTNTKLMEAAQYLYRSHGFREISMYPESEILPEEWMDSLFFEMDLEVGGRQSQKR